MSIANTGLRTGLNPIIEQDALAVLQQIDLSRLRSKRVLITGSNGLLGGFMAQVLHCGNMHHRLGCHVACLSRHGPKPALQNLVASPDFTFHQADLTEPFVFEGSVDYIIHGACYAQPNRYLEDKLKTIDLGVTAVRNLLNLARQRSAKFIFLSSADAYGDIPPELGRVTEAYTGNVSTTAPRAVYREAKRLGETICSIYQRDFKVPVHVLRLATAYGPGVGFEDQRVLSDFIRMAVREHKIRMQDPGASLKQIGYLADIVAMMFNVALSGTDLVYNIAGVDMVSIRQLADTVAQSVGGVSVEVASPSAPQEHIGTDAKCAQIDISKYLNEFGPQQFTPVTDGIHRTVEWNLQQDDIQP